MPTTDPARTRRRTSALTLTLTLALVATFVVTACGAAAAPQLAGREFVSIGVTDGGAARPLVAGTKIQIGFTANEIRFSAGCNSMGGSYRIEGTRLFVNDVFTTEMGCDAERHAQDEWLSQLLGSGPTIRLIIDTLALDSGSIQVTLDDREVAEPDAKLVGPTWTVESIISGAGVSSVPPEPVATLVFKDDGTLEVNAGCNRGSGTWAAVGGGIEVGPLMLTKMACQKDGADLESAVLGVLEAGTIGAQIDSTLMTLTAGNQGLMLRAG